MGYTPFKRQFVIARTGLSPDATWRQRDLRDGWVLSHQQELELAEHRTADDRSVLVLGNAYGPRAAETGGSGRYAVLDWPHLGGDGVGGLMSIYHGRGGHGLVVGTSAGLVALALGRDPLAPDHPDPLKHHSPQSYVPAPGSRYAGVRRLLRDQRLNLETERTERHPAPILPLPSFEAAMDLAATELALAARELGVSTRGTLFLQLTAGLDSRTLVAAFAAEGVAFETVTLRSKAKPEEDITVAAAISRKLGVRHHVIDLESPPDPAARDAYWLHTGGSINDWDLTDLFPGNAYRFLGPGSVMVGGAGFEIGRQKFRAEFEGLTLENATGAEIWRRLAREPGPPVFTGFLDEWLAWRRADPYRLNLAASHYLDQRVGAWLPAALGGFDMLGGLTIHPAVNRRVFSALITPSLEDQVTGRLQQELIARFAPELTAFPVNPVSLRRRLRRFVAIPRRTVRAGIRAFRARPSPASGGRPQTGTRT